MKNLIVMTMLLALGVTACKKQPRVEPREQPKAQAQAPAEAQTAPMPQQPGETVLPGDILDQVPRSEADVAWAEVEKAAQPPEYPEEWSLKQPSKEDIAAFEKSNSALAAKAADKAREFYKKYPDDSRAGEAKQQEYRLLSVAVQLGATNRAKDVEALETARLKDPNIDEDSKLELRMQQLQRTLAANKDAKPSENLEAIEKAARALQKEFPKRPEIQMILLSAAEGWLSQNEVEKSQKLAKEVAAAEAAPDTQTAAEALLKKLERLNKPLNLKFKAVDGREVDVQAMKGKVVLVDFWATWCGPCMKELPNVKAAYDKLKGKGFEIVGISFDQDQDKLESIVQREKMTWPQHFDGSGQNKFGQEFGITGIPTMWLVDKKGNLRDLNARDDLAGKVEKLLAEN
jgi:thiol-disulfide isomerase/thioredoxin